MRNLRRRMGAVGGVRKMLDHPGFVHVLLVLVGTGLAAMTLAQHRRLVSAIRALPRAHPIQGAPPPLTIVRPIKGLDHGAARNLEALLTSAYAGSVQFLLVLDDTDDPAFALAMGAAMRHRARGLDVHVLTCGRPPEGRTGKLHAMIAGLASARGTFVAFSDSDTRPSRGLFAALCAELVARPRAGAVFAPAVAVSDGAFTLGDAGQALLLNAWYGPAAALSAGRDGRLPFVMGQAMVMRREAIRAIGGLECADGHLVDDMRLGACLESAGWENVQVGGPLAVVLGGHTIGAFLATFRRWILFGRAGLPASFIAPQVAKAATWSASAGLAIVSVTFLPSVPGLVAAVLAQAMYLASERSIYRLFAGEPLPRRYAGLVLAMPLVGGVALVSALASRGVAWRGRAYALDRTARLARPLEAKI